jgi:hypothetical protein
MVTSSEYRQAQLRKFRRKRRRVFVQDDQLDIVAAQVRGRARPLVRGICHGVRTGHENRRLAEVLSVPVIGTDIATIRGRRTYGGHDFHETKEEWIGRFSFVYSNALDHSHTPELALETWANQLHPGGTLCIHWSPMHDGKVDAADCFAATSGEYESMVADVADDVRTEPLGYDHILITGEKA